MKTYIIESHWPDGHTTVVRKYPKQIFCVADLLVRLDSVSAILINGTPRDLYYGIKENDVVSLYHEPMQRS